MLLEPRREGFVLQSSHQKAWNPNAKGLHPGTHDEPFGRPDDPRTIDGAFSNALDESLHVVCVPKPVSFDVAISFPECCAFFQP